MIMFRFLAAFRLLIEDGFRVQSNWYCKDCCIASIICSDTVSEEHFGSFLIGYVSVSSSFLIAYTGRFMEVP